MTDYRPLSDRLRPQSWKDVVGQDHLLKDGQPLRRAIEDGLLHSMVLWGPPGSGKTTLARLLAGRADARFIQFSAVLGGVKDIRAAVAEARQVRELEDLPTIVFVDEVHRFNKSQQDAFLPHIEDGTITFIGATTENPAFELNNALLSRARVYVLKPLTEDSIITVLKRAVIESADQINIEVEALGTLALAADGDARRALNFLELAASIAGQDKITDAVLEAAISGGAMRRFDKGGDVFFDQISALHKSVRGSDPDAALYWFARMIDGGCDPFYIARRVVRMASEDIGNADPRALRIALDAWEVQQRLGSPEGELALAQALVYCAVAAKSNAVYTAFKAARADVQQHGSLGVPDHLRNAPTGLAKSMGHGAAYRYDHDEPDGFARGQQYFPEGMQEVTYYSPVSRGLEIRIAEKLAGLRARHAAPKLNT